jgi:hypothetical protein
VIGHWWDDEMLPTPILLVIEKRYENEYLKKKKEVILIHICSCMFVFNLLFLSFSIYSFGRQPFSASTIFQLP